MYILIANIFTQINGNVLHLELFLSVSTNTDVPHCVYKLLTFLTVSTNYYVVTLSCPWTVLSCF